MTRAAWTIGVAGAAGATAAAVAAARWARPTVEVAPARPVLHGQAMVTGGTSGIGLAFARALAERGCDLVLVARHGERLKKTAGQLSWRYGITVETLEADLATREGAAAAAERLADPDRPIEVLVNNAGKGVHVPLAAEDTSEHEASIDLMIRSVLILGAAAGGAMRARGHGAIINVASVAGLIPMGAYSAIKSWVDTYSESLAMELGGDGVQVLSVRPGWVRTEFHERAGIRTTSIPDFLWLDAERVVEDALADLDRGKIHSTSTLRFKVLAAAAAHAPRPLVRWATAKIKGGRS
ncbi:SDR family NAD(P)-dependent oxidoreductase [Bogoriella caseilytica]|uniref:Short-subunit dehydrogenase n=1 Tax=Bogoriella caseilytica TaxID=56055 RepID=A0A3N2BDD8_9MICO|nr:SDR family NAD(P)-dependent oxidoreductase [Bogoriella caseilytica]ROR73270.1 hypothetical protein EDD31_1645 [Bogoriella caseilytica]